MITGAICLNTAQSVAQKLTQEKQVLFTYGDFYPAEVSGYEILVIESAHFDSEDIAVLKQNNNTVLAYISLGEVNEAAAHFPVLKDFTFGKNEIWNSHILDIENEETREALMAIFDYNMKKGLDGMFLDNIDNYTEFGPTPEKKEALIDFLKVLNIVYPNIYLMQNAGVSIIKDTHPYIESVAKESIATDFNFLYSKYQLRDEEVFKQLLEELNEVYKKYEVPVVLIEYAETPELKKAIKQRLEQTNWPYFIGKIDLQDIPD
ncbi:endo alpha-1,4 polygalactosaminidase [Salegentibacter sp. LM13S]|uniref:endo alpha-1,4 polygalactosaminidase n=1 Tax=Salegentibacter lacus TaxID=2873599 RepID=UPI001CCE24C3|nr:endo alpha-1,4 polygalactosaminidase [Salegentibacter lacus]MBZ9631862.1 endo alpha-1,4 polygalactosaminidase [Salegentibacter lacus]